MKEITLYREDNGQYSTSEAQQDDVSGVYVQKEHLTDLQKQNDELRAGIAVLASLPIKIRMECRKQIKLNPDQFAEALMNYVQSAISGANAEQSLADIRAEAAQDEIDRLAAIMGREFGEKTEGFLKLYKLKLEKDHANRIKEG